LFKSGFLELFEN